MLSRFFHLQEEEKLTDEGKKVKKETMIFHRYHQLKAVCDLVTAAAAQANPMDKFQLVFSQVLESLFIERMELNEVLFVRYMNDPEFKELVSHWLGQLVYGKTPKNITYQPQKKQELKSRKSRQNSDRFCYSILNQ